MLNKVLQIFEGTPPCVHMYGGTPADAETDVRTLPENWPGTLERNTGTRGPNRASAAPTAFPNKKHAGGADD